jgi:transposase
VPHSSFLSTIYPHWTAVQLQGLTVVQQHLLLDVVSIRRRARCPDCQRLSRRVHSHFTRLVTDLPLAGFPVSLRLHGRRFRCLNRTCPRQTFRERVPEIVLPYQRRTPALKRRLEAVGFALGGQAGARLVVHLQLAMSGASRNSLLRLVRQAVLPDSEGTRFPLRILGIDDFAFRRGVRYGAIVVNLEHHRVVDVLANRDAATMAAWLEQHGGSSVEIVSRDRGGAFAEAVRQAAPQATQVADRFHILQNLGQALDRILTREHTALTRAADTVSRAPTKPTKPRQVPPQNSIQEEQPPRTRLERDHAAVEARRRDRYKRVLALAQEGYSLREIGRRARVSRGTVRSYVRAGQYRPCARPSRRPQACDTYAAYLRARWAEGEHNSAMLWEEIRAQGYVGALSTVRQYVRAWRTGPRHTGRRRQGEDADGPPPPPPRRFSPRQTRWILLRPLEDLTELERAYRQALCQASPPIALAQALANDFGRIIRCHAAANLNDWLLAARRSRIPELVSFAGGILRDFSAVAAALTLAHSQGQVEGQVNRLKLLKRQSYGRANLDLLRCRLLYQGT